MPRKFLVIVCSSFLMIVAGCKKENINEQLGIPFVNVSRYIFLNDPLYTSLNPIGGFAFIDGGSRGIVVYHRSFDEFVAFDRHCTWQTSEGCQIQPDTATTVILNCPCCSSRFSIVDGTVLTGPAINSLLQYRAQMSSPGTLHIYN